MYHFATVEQCYCDRCYFGPDGAYQKIWDEIHAMGGLTAEAMNELANQKSIPHLKKCVRWYLDMERATLCADCLANMIRELEVAE